MARARPATLACALALVPVLATAACADADDDGDAATPIGGTAVTVAPGGGAPGSTGPVPSTTAPPITPTNAAGLGGPAAPLPGVPVVGIGETVTGGGYQVVVRSVAAPAAPPGPTATPPPGHSFIRVDMELTNVGDSSRDATYLRFDLRDASGTVYTRSRWGDDPSPGWVPAGDPLQVSQLFEVPQLATGLLLTMRPDVLSDPVIAVRLT